MTILNPPYGQEPERCKYCGAAMTEYGERDGVIGWHLTYAGANTDTGDVCAKCRVKELRGELGERQMRFLTNIYNPKRPNANLWLSPSDWRKQQHWLSDKVIGRPQATEKHTVEELEALGVVGVYATDKETEVPREKIDIDDCHERDT